jgi:hypothetical protein
VNVATEPNRELYPRCFRDSFASSALTGSVPNTARAASSPRRWPSKCRSSSATPASTESSPDSTAELPESAALSDNPYATSLVSMQFLRSRPMTTPARNISLPRVVVVYIENV